MLLFVTISTVTGIGNIENSEICQNRGTGMTMAPGDIVIDFDAQTAHGETGVLGAEWDGQYFWTSSRGLVSPPHKFFVWDIGGNLIHTYDQPAQASTWGIRDLAFDGTYLYGGSENGFWQIDPSDGSTTLMFSSMSPMTIIRALAWEPNEGMFYTGSFALGWYKFTPDGTTITAITNPGLTAVYGMAYDNYNDSIWVFDQTGSTPNDCTFFEYDHHGAVLTGEQWTIPMLGGNTAQIAGGAFFADDIISGKAILGGMTQGTPTDWFFCLDIGTTNMPPSTPAAPTGPASGITGVEYTFTATTTDPEGEDIYYWFEWGDGENSGWVGPYNSGQEGSASHIWTSAGDFDVKVKAKDANGGESDWSPIHVFTIESGPMIEITSIKGGFLFVKAKIKNSGATAATNVDWTIDLQGGAWIGGSSSGTISSIAAGAEAEVTSSLIIGLGPTVVTVTATIPEGSDSEVRNGQVLLIYIIVNIGG